MPVLLLVAMYIGGAGELSCERQTAKGHKIVVILMSCFENQGIPTTQPADIHSKRGTRTENHGRQICWEYLMAEFGFVKQKTTYGNLVRAKVYP